MQMFTGTSLTLECLAEGTPRPFVSWTKNAQPLESKDRVSIEEDGTMIIIRNTQLGDTGRYMCLAKSAIGETHEASSVYIRGNNLFSINYLPRRIVHSTFFFFFFN